MRRECNSTGERKIMRGFVRWLVVLVSAAAILASAYIWVVLSWSFSAGERAGYVQKLSRKGWLCKTWEGELALITMPGTVAEKFYFSVRDDSVAEQINRSIGNRVALVYEEHVGIPTTCFAETRYFVNAVKIIQDPAPIAPAPAPQPSAPPAPPPAPVK
jgi:hypothetical protein